MTSSRGFWVLLWAEILTSIFAAGGGPIDYRLPYPSIYSYVGEHVLVWTVVVYLIHVCLSWFNKSPFRVRFQTVKAALASYVLVGLVAELTTSLFLWHDQAMSPKGVQIWVDVMNPHHVLRSFLLNRTADWCVFFFLLFVPICAFRARKSLLNQS